MESSLERELVVSFLLAHTCPTRGIALHRSAYPLLFEEFQLSESVTLTLTVIPGLSIEECPDGGPEAAITDPERRRHYGSFDSIREPNRACIVAVPISPTWREAKTISFNRSLREDFTSIGIPCIASWELPIVPVSEIRLPC